MVGRIEEINTLNDALFSNQSELIAIYGRRRIGKTYLIRTHFAKQLIYSCSGLFEGTLKEQLREFAANFKLDTSVNLHINQPKDWFEAFEILKNFIKSKNTKVKKVIFLDEVPWLATPKSRFLTRATAFKKKCYISVNIKSFF